MIVRLWGTRGSLASSGPETAGYGGNTASVEIVSADGTILALDAGTGIRRLGAAIDPSVDRLDILLTHLHMDHIQGLGFFAPFFRPSGEIHVWGPASATMDLRTRLTRYLSPPLFPVRIRDLDARVVLHDAPEEPVSIGGFEVVAAARHPSRTDDRLPDLRRRGERRLPARPRAGARCASVSRRAALDVRLRSCLRRRSPHPRRAVLGCRARGADRLGSQLGQRGSRLRGASEGSPTHPLPPRPIP